MLLFNMRVQESVKMALIICELYTIVVGGLSLFYQDIGLFEATKRANQSPLYSSSSS